MVKVLTTFGPLLQENLEDRVKVFRICHVKLKILYLQVILFEWKCVELISLTL